MTLEEFRIETADLSGDYDLIFESIVLKDDTDKNYINGKDVYEIDEYIDEIDINKSSKVIIVKNNL